jgi:predicted AAA+ superfamily ATPase
VIRGARQVGKTWLVRDLALRHDLELVECNFERDPALARCFESNDPRRILMELGIALGREIRTEGTLLFLDEIQAAGEVIARLRWFAEELPELPLVAAGSLLEFTLARHEFSMPVGRITFLHLEPMAFDEYLSAHGESPLLDALTKWKPGEELSPTAFERARDWFGRYVAVGGMPAVVRSDIEEGDPNEVRRLQHDLLAAYRNDFAKYARRVEPTLLDAVLRSVGAQLSRKFVYSHVAEGIRHERARHALELLAQARLCHVIAHTAANGIPLGGEVNPRNRKVIALDLGLAQALLGAPVDQVYPTWAHHAPGVKGALMEQAVGQQLRSAFDFWEEPRLYYWQRVAGRAGEIDYVVQVGARIVPVEVKAGAAGRLRALHQFMHDKQLKVAVRFDANPPTIQEMDIATTQRERVRYRLVSLPHFLVWRLADAVGGD